LSIDGPQSESNLISPAVNGLRKQREITDGLIKYRYDPEAYIVEKLGWKPWKGENGHPGQAEIIEAYVLALRQQHERYDLENGLITEDQLKYYKPGEPIKWRILVEAGHTVGKTKLESGLVNHFFDCFTPSIIYSFAPSWPQVHDLLWKEIKTDRRGKGLPGRILDIRLEVADDHFATGKATNDNKGTGTERAQGQHGKYLMFVLDEGEGIPGFVFDAVDSMSSGGIVIALYMANPRTRTSRFHKVKALPTTEVFRLSCINHPNVIHNREIVPNAVRRQYVEEMLEEHAEIVDKHSEDDHTFELPWIPGVIYKPDTEYLFRVLGIAPKNKSTNTLITPGRYEAAKTRERVDDNPHIARLGVDAARFGDDVGTLYIRHNGDIWRAAKFPQEDTLVYYARIKEEIENLVEKGISSIHIRFDGGGGFGSGPIDLLRADVEIKEWLIDFQVFEVHFNGTAYAKNKYADLVTELYAETAETLKGVRLKSPPNELEQDLTDRKYDFVNLKGKAVKKLEPKDKFKERNKRSPDDGDGCVLAAAPDFVFRAEIPASVEAQVVDRSDIEEMFN